MSNLLGEGYTNYVRKQINNRQKVYGKNKRSIKDIKYLNSRLAWVKVASSVSVDSDEIGKETLQKLGLQGIFNPGMDLAKSFILFNGTSALNGGPLKQREGIWNGSNSSMKNNNAYGLGGTDFGFSPMPGIIDLGVTNLGMTGALRKATITLKAYNREQFDVIDLLYLRLGFTMLVEWGNDHFINNKGDYENMFTTLIEDKFFSNILSGKTYIELLPLIEEKKYKTAGNYDAFFGRVTNYSWDFAPDGSYNIKIDLMSLGDSIESIKINGLSERFSKDTRGNVYQYNADNIIYKYLADVRAFWGSEEGGYDFEDWDTGLAEPEEGLYGDDLAEAAEEEMFMSSDRTGDEQPDMQGDEVDETYTCHFINGRPDKGTCEYDKRNQPDYDQDNLTKKFCEDTLGGEWTPDGDSPYSGVEDLFDTEDKCTDLGGVWEEEISPDPNKARHQRFERYQSDLKLKEDLKEAISKTSGRKSKFQTEGKVKGSDGKGLTGNYKHTYSDGSVYNGEWVDGFKSGNGKFTFVNGNYYEGQWRFNVYEGEGVYDFGESGRYVGKFLKGKLSGEGTMTFGNGGIYKGEWENSMRDGQGTMTYSDGSIFKGNFKKGDEISGTLTKTDGEKEEWANGKPINDPPLEEVPVDEAGNQVGNYQVNTINQKGFGGIINRIPAFSDKKSWDEFFPKTKYADHYKSNYGPDNFAFYIRFGALLKFFESDVIYKQYSTKSGPFPPTIRIDYDIESNVMFAIPNQISFDPRVCITNVKFKANDVIGDVFGGLERLQNDKPFYSKIMNIYLNHNFIINSMESNKNERGDIILYDFLSSVCTGLNRALGGVNNLQPTIDELHNCIKILDTSTDNVDKIAEHLLEKEGWEKYGNTTGGNSDTGNFKSTIYTLANGNIDYKLGVFGFNNYKTKDQQASFVTNISLKTTINKDYATILSIGATANKYVIGEEATAFSRLNLGLTDRFNQGMYGGQIRNKEQTEETERMDLVSVPVAYYEFLKRNFDSDGDQSYYIHSVVDEEKKDSNIEERKDIEFQDPIIGKINPENIEKNILVGTEFYKYWMTSASMSKPDFTSPQPGFIPISLEVDMDGMSGMKIFQKVNIDTSFLPKKYPKSLKFITTGLQHVIKDNKWKTTLTTHAIPALSHLLKQEELSPMISNVKKYAVEFKSKIIGFGRNLTIIRFPDTNPYPIIIKSGTTYDGIKTEVYYNSQFGVNGSFQKHFGSYFTKFLEKKGNGNPDSNVVKFMKELKKDGNDACIKVKNHVPGNENGDMYGGELGNGGDITKELYNTLLLLIKVLKHEAYKDIIPITITAGNDAFHHGKAFYNNTEYPSGNVSPANGTHTRGLAIDIGSKKSKQKNQLVINSCEDAGFAGTVFHGKGENAHTHTNLDPQMDPTKQEIIVTDAQRNYWQRNIPLP